MSPGIFEPFDMISPQQLISQYSDWLYFSLVLVFFIAIAGLTLRRHFDQPYVKPLIVSVGLMLTIAAFMKRDWLRMLFDGWGVVGAILLVVVVAVIPYGMARGFGMPAGKAFSLTYVLFYILSWVKFSSFYTGLADHRLGVVNLGLLALFLYAVYQMLPFRVASKIPIPSAGNFAFANLPAVTRDIDIQNTEEKAITNQIWPLTKQEIRTIGELEEALAGVQRVIEHSPNNMKTEDRTKIVNFLGQAMKKDVLFKNDLARMQKMVARISKIDAEELEKMRQRMNAASLQEKQVLRAEIQREGLKLKTEKEVMDCDQRLGRSIEAFQNLINEAAAVISRSAYPLDAKPVLAKSRQVLKDIIDILKEIKRLEERLLDLTRDGKKLLKNEKTVTG